MEFFLQQACAESGRKLPTFGRQLSDFLYNQYEFPGNIRELKNIAHYIAQTAGDETLTLENLPARYRQQTTVSEPSGSSSTIPGS